jgi:hypothetical protein
MGLKPEIQATVNPYGVRPKVARGFRKSVKLVFKHGLQVDFETRIQAVIKTKPKVGAEVQGVHIGRFPYFSDGLPGLEANRILQQEKGTQSSDEINTPPSVQQVILHLDGDFQVSEFL